MNEILPLIRIAPKEGNALSILAGTKRGTTSAHETLARLTRNGWLSGAEVKKVAEAMVDASKEVGLSDTERGILHNYLSWAKRNQQYTQSRIKKANARRRRIAGNA